MNEVNAKSSNIKNTVTHSHLRHFVMIQMNVQNYLLLYLTQEKVNFEFQRSMSL